MASIADAAANQDRAKRGLGEKSQSTVTREARGGGIVIHFANFAGGVDVHLFSHEGGQGEDLVKIADAPEEILVAEEFVEAVRCPGPPRKNCGVPVPLEPNVEPPRAIRKAESFRKIGRKNAA
jgi:hypothetical protein